MKKFSLLMAMILMASCFLMASCEEGESSVPFSAESIGTESTSKDEWKGAASGEADSAEDTSETSSQTGEEEPSDQPQTDAKYLDENGLFTVDKLGMPAFDFSKKTFTVCVYGDQLSTAYCSYEIQPDLYAHAPTLLNEGVRLRNDLLKEAYGVTVKAYAVDDVAKALRNDAVAGTSAYDAAMPFLPSASDLAAAGCFFDLNMFDQYIHPDAPWWDQSANRSLSVGGKLYFTTGDISITPRNASSAILFNKELYRELLQSEYGDLYELVLEGGWTIDTMYEMGTRATLDTDGVGGMSYFDTWGLVGTNEIIGFYHGSGNQLISKDQRDFPKIALGIDTDAAVYADKLVQQFQRKTWYFNTQSAQKVWDEPSVWDAAMSVFGNNRALFYAAPFSALDRLNTKFGACEYGIVPFPKASAQQETYYTTVSPSYVFGICIPAGAEDPNFSAYMIEALACQSKNYLTSTYDAGILMESGNMDENAAWMLSLIFQNKVYDLGVLHNFGGINLLGQMLSQKEESIASYLGRITPQVEYAINQYVEEYELNF